LLPRINRDSASDVQIIGSRRASRQACRGANAMAEDQAGVEHVAQEPLGKPGDAVGSARRMEEHQVYVAIGGDIAATITAVGHQGDLRP